MANTTTSTFADMPAEVTERIARLAIGGPTTTMSIGYPDNSGMARQKLTFEVDAITLGSLLRLDERFSAAIKNIFTCLARPDTPCHIDSTGIPGCLFSRIRHAPSWRKHVRVLNMTLEAMNRLQRFLRPYSEELKQFPRLTMLKVEVTHVSLAIFVSPDNSPLVRDMIRQTVGKWEGKETLKNFVRNDHPYETLLSLSYIGGANIMKQRLYDGLVHNRGKPFSTKVVTFASHSAVRRDFLEALLNYLYGGEHSIEDEVYGMLEIEIPRV